MKRIMIANGKYTNKDGQEKTRWVELGVIMEKNGKEFVLLNAYVNIAAFKEAGKDKVIAPIFTDTDKKEAPRTESVEPKDELDDEIPFALLLPLAIVPFLNLLT